jgi:hypothetical protein
MDTKVTDKKIALRWGMKGCLLEVWAQASGMQAD